jgi:methionyl-tRNA formyltransferase
VPSPQASVFHRTTSADTRVKIALATTATAHHAYYARAIAERLPLTSIVIETREVRPPFETFHPFEADRDAYEREVLSADVDGDLQAVAPVHAVNTIDDAVPHLSRLALDVVLVFGTGRLSREAIAAASSCLNLHGGNPEEYRGLDTHLWAIYHRDFDNLVATIHHVDESLDSGDVVDCVPVPLRNGMPLYELRSRNTEACVEMSLRALRAIEQAGRVAGTPQTKRGRYYSFMPAVLKDRCVAQFERHTARL